MLVLVSAALVALGIAGARRAARGAAAGRAPRAAGRCACWRWRAAALPVATYLAGLVPWERPAAPVRHAGRSVLAADLVVTAGRAARALAARTGSGPPLVVLAVTLATLLADVLTGSTLELNGLLGYDAIVAGRFTGYGNLTFGLHVGERAERHRRAGHAGRPAGRARPGPPGDRRHRAGAGAASPSASSARRVSAATSAACWPRCPGFLVLAMLLARVRVTVVRLVAVLAAAVVAVGTVAVLDWLRPPADRTHLGRFVEQVLTGEAWTVISRKGQANLDILLRSPLAWMLPVAVVAAVWLVRPGGLLRTPAGRPGGRPGGAVGRAGVRRPGGPAVGAAEPGARGRGQRLGRRAAGDGGRAAGAADGLAGRRARAAGAPVRGRRRVALPTPGRSRAPTVLRSSPVDRPSGTRDSRPPSQLPADEVRLRHRRRCVLSRQGTDSEFAGCPAVQPWPAGHDAEARPLPQRRPRNDEPVPARRGLRHRGRRRDRPRRRPLRALPRHRPLRPGQRDHRPGLLRGDRQGAARGVPRRHRAGHPAHHQRDQVADHGRRRGPPGGSTSSSPRSAARSATSSRCPSSRPPARCGTRSAATTASSCTSR